MRTFAWVRKTLPYKLFFYGRVNTDMRNLIISAFRFFGKLTRRPCRSCFRFGKHPRLPGRNVCAMHGEEQGVEGNGPCCWAYYPRWGWCISNWWSGPSGGVKWRINDWWRIHVRVPIGSRRSPVPIESQDCYDCHTDSIVPYSECPYCGEMPCSETQCQFCGQRFLGEVSL